MLGNQPKVISFYFNFKKFSYWRLISSKGISCLLHEFNMKCLTSTADILPSFLPRVFLNICSYPPERFPEHSPTLLGAHQSSLSAKSSLPGAHQPASVWAAHCLYTSVLPVPCFCSFSLAGELTSVTLCLSTVPDQSTVFVGTLSEGLDSCSSQPELSL